MTSLRLTVLPALLILAANFRGQETPKLAADAPALPPSLFGYDDGFFLRAADGKQELTINGRIQVDAVAYGPHREPETDFVDRRNRLEFAGKFPGGFKFHIEPNFVPEEFEMEEAWIGSDVFDANARVMIGRMKAPFLLEERNPQGNVDFPRFSILHQFCPAEDHGVFLYGHTPGNLFGYDLAVYNGTGGADNNGSKDAAVRGTLRPFANGDAAPLEHLQFGVAATYGIESDDVTGESIVNEQKLPVIRFEDTLQLDGHRTRIGLEGVWYYGPWFAQAELMHHQQDMSLASVDRSISFDGGYALLSHVLTGEEKSFGRTRPHSPFDAETGAGRGAWIVAARYSDLKSDSQLESAGFVQAGTFTDHIRTASLGLDWVPNENVILRCAILHTWYSDTVQLDHGSARSEDALIIELQLDF